ncbi:MAG: HlyD family secretion protein [Gemmataceae bacterium]
MCITNGMRLGLAMLGIAGMTVASISALRDFPHASVTPAGKPEIDAASEPVLAYGLVDVDGGIRRLALPLPGRVKEVRVKENDEAKAGDVLLIVDDEQARTRLRLAQDELEAAEMQLKDARQEPQRHRLRLQRQEQAVKIAKKRRDTGARELKRVHRWYENEIGFEQDVRTAEDLLQSLEAAVRIEECNLEELRMSDPFLKEAQAQKLVDARQAQLTLAEHDLRQHELRAPEAGKILTLLVREGDLCSGIAGQPALEFCPNRPLIVRAEVGQEWVARLKPGQKVLLRDDEEPELKWDGKVQRVADWLTLSRSFLPGPREMHDQRTAKCIIEPKSGSQRLRIGQKLRVILASSGR